MPACPSPEPDSADRRFPALGALVAGNTMTIEEQKTAPVVPSKWRHWTKTVLLVKLRLVIAGILLGYLYAWASPLVYPKDRPLGFAFGFAHGGLMPMALPSLVIGKNVPIFAENNNGRLYKLGYICGINV